MLAGDFFIDVARKQKIAERRVLNAKAAQPTWYDISGFVKQAH